MSAVSLDNKQTVARFHTRLLAAMMLIVATLTALGFYFAQRKITADAERALQQSFQTELSGLHKLEELRHAALVERCSALAAKPRIHAALEDNALDLLYPSAKDELRDLMEGEELPPERGARWLHANFYRFLAHNGAVLPPPEPKDVGELSSGTEAQLSLKKLPTRQQIGHIQENSGPRSNVIDEVIAVPIFSTETGDVISCLVVGLKPFEIAGNARGSSGMRSGIWVNGRLHLPSPGSIAQTNLDREIANAISNSSYSQNSIKVTVDDAQQLLFFKLLNPDSLFPPAYEICVYPLTHAIAQLHRVRWQIGGAGALLLLVGFVGSQFVAARLSMPVEKLALISGEIGPRGGH